MFIYIFGLIITNFMIENILTSEKHFFLIQLEKPYATVSQTGVRVEVLPPADGDVFVADSGQFEMTFHGYTSLPAVFENLVGL